MRRIRRSITFVEQLERLLEQGIAKFGLGIADEKRHRLEVMIDTYLVRHPRMGLRDDALGLYVYPITNAPFVVIYDFDEDELRLYAVLHQRADRRRFDPTTVQW